MAEEVLFEIEKKMSNSEIADYLRDIAKKIDAKENISLKSGEQEVNLDTNRSTVFELKVEREDNEESLEIELEWEESGKSSELNIE